MGHAFEGNRVETTTMVPVLQVLSNLVTNAVQHAGEDISVKSERGHGTTFTVLLRPPDRSRPKPVPMV